MTDFTIEDASERHMASVLQLNEQFVHYLSPLDADSLAELAQMSDYFRVVELQDEVVAFLIALFPGANYDSPNYRWFDGQGADFAYIDRIVVSDKARGLSLGTRLYDDLGAYARSQGINRLTCEYNIRPMNEGSARFHERYGFVEVGQQQLAGGKVVSLQTCPLA